MFYVSAWLCISLWVILCIHQVKVEKCFAFIEFWLFDLNTQRLLIRKWGFLASPSYLLEDPILFCWFRRMEIQRACGLLWKKGASTTWNSPFKLTTTLSLVLGTPILFGRPVLKVIQHHKSVFNYGFETMWSNSFLIWLQWTEQRKCLEPLVLNWSHTTTWCQKRPLLLACLLEDHILQELRSVVGLRF